MSKPALDTKPGASNGSTSTPELGNFGGGETLLGQVYEVVGREQMGRAAVVLGALAGMEGGEHAAVLEKAAKAARLLPGM